MITLIGNSLANKGLKFMHYGAISPCESCRFKNTCIDALETGRMYIIKNVKNGEQPCKVHEGGKVRVVEVEKAYIRGVIDSKQSFEGSRIAFNPPECDEDCSLKNLCFPEGLYRDDKCKIIRNMGKPREKCLKGRDLNTVLLKY